MCIWIQIDGKHTYMNPNGCTYTHIHFVPLFSSHRSLWTNYMKHGGNDSQLLLILMGEKCTAFPNPLIFTT